MRSSRTTRKPCAFARPVHERAWVEVADTARPGHGSALHQVCQVDFAGPLPLIIDASLKDEASEPAAPADS